jgi:hypothetical protein
MDLLGTGWSEDAPVGGPQVDAGERGRGRGRDEKREHQVIRSVVVATVGCSATTNLPDGRAFRNVRLFSPRPEV